MQITVTIDDELYTKAMEMSDPNRDKADLFLALSPPMVVTCQRRDRASGRKIIALRSSQNSLVSDFNQPGISTAQCW
jgi:hypothetical protein